MRRFLPLKMGECHNSTVSIRPVFVGVELMGFWFAWAYPFIFRNLLIRFHATNADVGKKDPALFVAGPFFSDWRLRG